MNVKLSSGNILTRPAGALVIGIFEGERKLTGAAAAVDRAARGAIASLLASRDFTGRFLETAVLYPRGVRAKRVLLVGLGRPADLNVERVRAVAGVAARRARALGAGSVVTVVHGAGRGGLDPGAAAQAVAEGSVLGPHRFTGYLRDPGPPPLRSVELIEMDADAARRMRAAAERGARWAEGTCLARDLAATPGQDLTPERLGARALEVAKRSGARARVLGVPQMEKLGMGAVLAVGRGSVNPPCFIELEHPAARGARTKRTVVVIGKGVTFDTGGISLKPRENMGKMKYDMSGAAAVLGLFSALPTLELPFRVVGLIPSAENMPGGRALKPGDVIRALDGTTIEVTNTDAEGRLLLADALAYAQRFEPEAVVDLATLTGAIGIALGHRAAGLFSRDDALADALLAAGDASGERLWRMPLWEAYAEDMRSDVADILNSAVREGGAILGATFLAPFAGRMPWAHLDIAGVGWADSDRPTAARGPVGFGVRLLLEWLSRRGTTAA